MSDWKFETQQIHAGAAPDPVDQRPRDADLQDDLVRVQQHRRTRRTCSRSPSSATSTRAS